MSQDLKQILKVLAVFAAIIALGVLVTVFDQALKTWPSPLVFGSFWFWTVVVAEVVLLIGLVEWNKGPLATLSLLATLALLHLFGDLNIAGYVIAHPWTVLAGVGAYFLAGTAWSVAKWWLYVREQRGRYDELRTDFCLEHGLTEGRIDGQLAEEWSQRLQAEHVRGRKIEVPPLVREHKGDILRWMTYWPFSLVWTVLDDPVRKTFQMIYRHLQERLQAIADRAFAGVEADFPQKKG
jgi:hypothetical protein